MYEVVEDLIPVRYQKKINVAEDTHSSIVTGMMD